MTQAQSSAATLDIVSWNIEYFGAPYNSGPTDKDLQEVNAKRILHMLNADLYGVLEIVDSMRFRRLVDSLGQNEYGFVIAPFCSSNTNGTGASWTSGQKQAFIYRKSIFSNVRTRGIMRNSTPAYTNWASGRFPFLFSATATINGVSKDINVFLLHGKAGATQADYDKRFGAAQELKDTLDAQFNNTLNIIIGDFNDALNTSIYPGATVSSYTSIVADSTDGDSYKSITLPLGAAGQSTMINFPNVIDNHIISNEYVPYYVPGSVKVRTDVTTVVSDYVSAHNTSDHYPVFSQYNLSGVVSGTNNVSPQTFGLSLFPNPGHNAFWLQSKKNIPASEAHLYNASGQLIWSGNLPRLTAGVNLRLSLPLLPAGNYQILIANPEGRTLLPFIQL
ncbi:MAG: endonuclease/exonuclease/phosphatase [Bacteroidota bacterium]